MELFKTLQLIKNIISFPFRLAIYIPKVLIFYPIYLLAGFFSTDFNDISSREFFMEELMKWFKF